MLDLDDLRMMRALGGAGSLAAAARSLDLTPPALTTRLQRLEQALGVHLAVRGARGITLTDEGRRLVAEATDILARLDGLPQRVSGNARVVTGLLRVAAPFGFGREHITPIVRDLHRTHPQLQVSLRLSEHPMRDAADNDVVIHIGPLKDSSWITHALAPNARLLCASPAYARRLESRLTHPSQLQDHTCLCLKENEEDLTRWRFTHLADRQRVNVRVSGPLSSNDGAAVTRWALDGLGIMARSEWEAAPLIARGRLVQLLPDWAMDDAPILALTPTRHGASARLRVFIDACKAALQTAPWRRAPSPPTGPEPARRRGATSARTHSAPPHSPSARSTRTSRP